MLSPSFVFSAISTNVLVSCKLGDGPCERNGERIAIVMPRNITPLLMSKVARRLIADPRSLPSCAPMGCIEVRSKKQDGVPYKKSTKVRFLRKNVFHMAAFLYPVRSTGTVCNTSWWLISSRLGHVRGSFS